MTGLYFPVWLVVKKDGSFVKNHRNETIATKSVQRSNLLFIHKHYDSVNLEIDSVSPEIDSVSPRNGLG